MEESVDQELINKVKEIQTTIALIWAELKKHGLIQQTMLTKKFVPPVQRLMKVWKAAYNN